jgi:predicted acetyltransferase
MYEIRTITADDAELFRSRVSQGFGRDADHDETSVQRFEAIFEYDRTFAAFEGGDIVGTCAAFSLGLTAPGGGEVPMGGTTVIAVRPTHRRRGVLRALMDAHLEEIESRGEPLAGLWASEGSIYGRFGYGPATYKLNARIDARGVSFIEPDAKGSVRLIEGDDVEPTLRSVHERARPMRAGMLTRSDGWWTHRVMADPESWRGGKSAHRHVIHQEGGEVTGYAAFRQKSKWDDSLPRGEVSVTEVLATTPDAHRGLWRFLTSIDLFPNVEYWNLPVDDPLPLEVANHRLVSMKLEDGLWVRLMDISDALDARAYQHDGEVVFTAHDSTRPAQTGIYRLEIVDGVGHCERVETTPELELDVEVLGRLYLGGGDAHALAAAGRIEGNPGAVTRLHRIMRTDVAPWCPEVF